MARRKKRKFKFPCDLCEKILKKPGALLLSPPNKKNKVRKFHICKPCWKVIKPILPK